MMNKPSGTPFSLSPVHHRNANFWSKDGSYFNSSSLSLGAKPVLVLAAPMESSIHVDTELSVAYSPFSVQGDGK